jgi:DNA polymerase III delta prime subunit
MLSSADEFFGQDLAKRFLTQALAKGRLVNSFLMSGPRGLGKTEMAFIFTRAINCVANGGDSLAFCGECFPCRSIARREQSDFLFVHPETKEITARLIKEKYDNFSSALRFPQHLRRRVIVIDEAHYLNEETSNQMLKLFEDAPALTTFILVTDMPSLLLPTVQSRCMEVAFTPEPPKRLAAYLKQRLPSVPPRTVDEIAATTGGCIAPALLILESAEMTDAVLKGAAAFEAYLTGKKKLGRVFEMAQATDDLAKGYLARLVEYEAASLDIAADEIKKERVNELERQALFFALDLLLAAYARLAERGKVDPAGMDVVARAKERIRQNVIKSYVLESAFVELARV